MSMTAQEELAQAEARLAAYRTAELRILESQEWKKGEESSQRAALEDVREQIDKLTVQIRTLSNKLSSGNGGIRVRTGVVSYE